MVESNCRTHNDTTSLLRIGSPILMSQSPRVRCEEIDHLLRNAQLRDELEPYCDEAVYSLNTRRVPTPIENEFLASMLEWERAPIVPIAQWFDPELQRPAPESLDDAHVHSLLWQTIQQLFGAGIVLDFTDHLSDRQLYTIIYRDILPAPEKRINRRENFLHWDCANSADDPETWLRYYADEEERREWLETDDAPLPAVEPLPYPRQLPRRPSPCP